ncbi:hypothetical protein OHB26_38240 [Nocardia sp. NBC_01503]|uniref:hypothetical protein n=1 Tax=Nocardia sp. NBC_01503 TaxID=2975997 RepID=UPI002E7C1205|nr:hypothetical protein [Nocardia sp. NBC_01503]WTL32620.1 hypothetical protein OHB26_38240 [Nocardia sp. NBC_01503]
MFVLGIIIAAYYAYDFAGRGDSVHAIFGLIGCLLFITFVGLAAPHVRVRRRLLPRSMLPAHSDSDRAGLRLTFLAAWKMLLTAWLAIASVFLIARGVLFLAEVPEASDSMHAALIIGGFGVSAAGLALAIFMARYLMSWRREHDSILLSEYGIELSLGSSARSIRWDEIGDVRPCIVNNSRVVRVAPVPGERVHVEIGRSLLDRMQRSFYEQSLDLHPGVLSVDPALLFHLVRFYWKHPEARRELASESVLDRLHRGDLPE